MKLPPAIKSTLVIMETTIFVLGVVGMGVAAGFVLLYLQSLLGVLFFKLAKVIVLVSVLVYLASQMRHTFDDEDFKDR